MESLQDDGVGYLVRISVLKAVGSLCYVSEGIRELAKTDGLEVIVAIIGNFTKEEEEQRKRTSWSKKQKESSKIGLQYWSVSPGPY